MKTWLWLLLLFCFPLGAVTLKLECNKNRVYVGEDIQCEYALYSRYPELEVEIAKFPEFQGFWKDNHILRQGKISFLFEPPMPNGERRSVISSYTLIPMVDETQPKIEPMKLVLKTQAQIQEPLPPTLLSEKTGLLIQKLPLPKLPSHWPSFTGAVGTFSLYLERRTIPFHSNQPFTVRVLMQGKGNFPEINRLHSPFGQDFKVLSFRSLAEGSSLNQIKTFEWSLQALKDQNFELAPFKLVFFNPQEGRYRITESPSLKLEFKPSNQGTALLEEKKTPKPLLSKPHFSQFLWQEKIFWFIQCLLFVSYLSLWISLGLKKINKIRLESPKRLRRLSLQRMDSFLASKDLDSFLKEARLFAVQALKLKLKHSPDPCTHSILLQAAQKEFSPSQWETLQRTLQFHENYSYRPDKNLLDSPEQILANLKRLG